MRAIAAAQHDQRFFLYLGRHIGLPVCLEGALKLKEISYIPTDAYAAGRDEARADRPARRVDAGGLRRHRQPGAREGPLQRRGGPRPRRRRDRDRDRGLRAGRRGRRPDDRASRAPTGSCSRSSRSCRCSCSPTTSPAPAASTSTSRATWRRPSPSSRRTRFRGSWPDATVESKLACPMRRLLSARRPGGDPRRLRRWRRSSSVDVGPAAAVPANAALYLDGTVKPTGTAQSDAKAALSKIMKTPDPGAKIISLIEKQSKADGHPINYQQDVAPWLGQKAGSSSPSLGQTRRRARRWSRPTNPGASSPSPRRPRARPRPIRRRRPTTAPATRPTQQLSRPGSDGLRHGRQQVPGRGRPRPGSRPRSTPAKGDSLGDDERLQGRHRQAAERPPRARSTRSPRTLIDALGPEQFGAQQQQQLETESPATHSTSRSRARSRRTRTASRSMHRGQQRRRHPESSLIGDVPAQSWLALGIGNLGDAVKRTVDQLKDQIPNFERPSSRSSRPPALARPARELRSATRSSTSQGTTQSTLNGALVVQTKNPDLTGRLLGQLQTLVQLGGGTAASSRCSCPGAAPASRSTIRLGRPGPLEIAQQGDKFVIGYGANSAEQSLDAGQKLSDSPTFSTATLPGLSLGTDLFLDFPWSSRARRVLRAPSPIRSTCTHRVDRRLTQHLPGAGLAFAQVVLDPRRTGPGRRAPMRRRSTVLLRDFTVMFSRTNAPRSPSSPRNVDISSSSTNFFARRNASRQAAFEDQPCTCSLRYSSAGRACRRELARSSRSLLLNRLA